jgi:hypothetical protein
MKRIQLKSAFFSRNIDLIQYQPYRPTEEINHHSHYHCQNQPYVNGATLGQQGKDLRLTVQAITLHPFIVKKFLPHTSYVKRTQCLEIGLYTYLLLAGCYCVFVYVAWQFVTSSVIIRSLYLRLNGGSQSDTQELDWTTRAKPLVQQRLQ